MSDKLQRGRRSRSVSIPVGAVTVAAQLSAGADVGGIVIFAHERPPGATSERNAWRSLLAARLASLRFRREPPSDRVIALHGDDGSSFDVHGMARKIVAATDWLGEQAELSDLAIGYMGSGAAAGAVLIAAARRPARVAAVVVHAGRPDLAGRAVAGVTAPTLLIVGGRQLDLLERNEAAFARLRCDKRLVLLADTAESGRGRSAAGEAMALAGRYFARRLLG